MAELIHLLRHVGHAAKEGFERFVDGPEDDNITLIVHLRSSVRFQVRPKAAQPLHKAHQGSLFRQIVDATPSLIRPPVHALWLRWKIHKHVRASTQPHSNFL